jgi:uncharacterized repeat protein (TIGR03803 family)
MNTISKWTMAFATVLLSAAITTPTAQAQTTFKTLHSFDGTDGQYPYAGLIQATNGDFYGTTEVGGTGSSCGDGCGTVFQITPSGTLTTRYSFDPNVVTDGYGYYPEAVLLQATNGYLYGTTVENGNDDNGTVFRITPSGALTPLHVFGLDPDGSAPYAGLIQATNGDFYGTTREGGAHNFGTVFKMTPGGTLTTIYTFCSQSSPPIYCTDGDFPLAGLIQAANGDFYGTTEQGGANNRGTVFQITPSGKLTTLYSFCSQANCTDGNLATGVSLAYGGLIQAADGNFYGTTQEGGTTESDCVGGCGTVFQITPSGKLTTLYSFCSQSSPPTYCKDGWYPVAGLVQATDGNFYGTTARGGTNGDYGTVFQITLSGTLTTLATLHSFDGKDGQYAYAGLIQSTNGDFYGTTVEGGAHGDGTVFRLSVDLGAFVKTLPASGNVGSAVRILGADLTGVTSVTFSGTAATLFTVVSKSEIKTTVPTGATTGFVEVVTPGGTLESNVAFTVTP